MHLLSLVGEQPIPVLLADRALNPERHLLVHTNLTRSVARHLRALLPHAEMLELKDPYALDETARLLEKAFTPGMSFNLTSGTKPMAWAGYQVVSARRGKALYLESEKKRTLLHRLDFSSGGVHQTSEVLPGLLTLKEYLGAHGQGLPAGNASVNNQETALHMYLQDQVDECLHNLQFDVVEVDFILRRGNQVAVVEAKSGLSRHKRKRDGLDQLTTIAGREYLGTYTGRIWVVARMPGYQLQELARAYQVEIVPVEIQGQVGKWRLVSESRDRLARALDKTLGVHQS